MLTLSRDAFEFASALQRLERRRGGHQAAQNDRSRDADALVFQIELRDAVFTQRDERDAAEIGQRGRLEHHLGQIRSSVAGDVVETDAAHARRVSGGADTFVSVT